MNYHTVTCGLCDELSTVTNTGTTCSGGCWKNTRNSVVAYNNPN